MNKHYLFFIGAALISLAVTSFSLYQKLHRDDAPEVNSVHAYHCVKIYQFNDGTTKWYYHSHKKGC